MPAKSDIAYFCAVFICISMSENRFQAPYCEDFFNRKRMPTSTVQVGNTTIGGKSPIRVQSMTTTDTMDTDGSIQQSVRMIEAGCELVRLTAPSMKEAENLRVIRGGLHQLGFKVPLVADIHFTPNAAEIAARIVEKVRVNPGNYADKKRFEEHIYTDESYQSELTRIKEKFSPLIELCKAHGTAMRIGTNHGSLSDRILSRYGDTPEGMVESAMEFLRVCAEHDYHDVVLSMKASNTLVMVEAYRLLAAVMKQENMSYPLHLGVTEAGDGEDGRIKSAVGIGALLEDGLGDTIRVSLTEAPEAEIPVAQKLIDKFREENQRMFLLHENHELPYDPIHYQRRSSREVVGIGDHHVPVIVADLSRVGEIRPSHFFGFGYHYSVPLDKWNLSDTAADLVYIGDQRIDFELPGTLKVLTNLPNFQKNYSEKPGFFPLVTREELGELHSTQTSIQTLFIRHRAEDSDVQYLLDFPNSVIILDTEYTNKTQLYRYFYLNSAKINLKNPVILCAHPTSSDAEQFQLWASSDLGSVLIDGFGDGIWLSGAHPAQLINTTSFGILQATRTRISKTEYISCPSCGRTLFDLQETTAKIRSKTSHLKGIKIGIMGCIVNGPGEMADADYGYVGTGPGKIHLYKEKTIVRKNVPEAEAVDALIELIREHGDWIDPQAENA